MNKRKAIVLVLAIAALLWGKTFYEARTLFLKGEASLKTGNVEEAIHSFDRSAHWYAPGNPYVGRALEKLWDIGQSQEKTSVPLALLSYDALRGSVHAIRSLYWPYRSWLERVNPRIAELRARQQVEQQNNLTFEAALAFHKKALEADPRPKTAWVVLVELGFWGWILCTIGWIWRGFTSDGVMHFRASLHWMAGMVLFFATFVVGLLKA